LSQKVETLSIAMGIIALIRGQYKVERIEFSLHTPAPPTQFKG
jgi:hypothetical protein